MAYGKGFVCAFVCRSGLSGTMLLACRYPGWDSGNGLTERRISVDCIWYSLHYRAAALVGAPVTRVIEQHCFNHNNASTCSTQGQQMLARLETHAPLTALVCPSRVAGLVLGTAGSSQCHQAGLTLSISKIRSSRINQEALRITCLYVPYYDTAVAERDTYC